MIEQQNNLLLISFPTPEAAASFKELLEALLRLTNQSAPASSEPPSDQSPHSRHTVLTDERLAQLSNQREQGQTRHQRLLKAQTTLRDGTLPFKQLSTVPLASGQPSPRQKAQQVGGFADGAAPVGPKAPQLGRPQAAPEAGRRKKSQLRPVLSPKPSQS